MPKLRVVQVGLGPVGVAIARLAAERDGLDLVGAADPRPDLVGRDLADLLGAGPSGSRIAADAETLVRSHRPDVVLHATGSRLAEVARELRVLIPHRLAIVSTCEELAYPFYRHPELALELDRLATEARSVLLGTGVNPGFVMDKLIATLLGACRTVRSVRVSRVVDASARREPLQRKIGAGITLEEFETRRREERIGHVGLAESAHMIGDVIGLPADRALRETLGPRLATRRIETAFLVVEIGRVSGIEQSAEIESGGIVRVRLDLRMEVGAEDSRDAMVVDGSPPISFAIPGGLHGDEATAAIAVNCAGLAARLEPGLRTMLDVPVRFSGAV